MSALNELENLGQSIWLDFIDRNLVRDGGLRRLIDEDGITGVTSNPAIFEKAIAETHEYDDAIRKILDQRDRDVFQIYDELAVKDIQDAADLLFPTHQRLKGKDGFISLEVSPYLASNTDATIREARRLWSAVARPNVMIKVPATQAGIPAIRQLIEDGVNVNTTLLFSVPVYEQVAQAFIAGLEARRAKGESLGHVDSVASFFVSRIDVMVDRLLEERSRSESDPAARVSISGLFGRVAIANAKAAYEAYQKIYSSPRWERLVKAGANPQRLLWASTSTKNPKYRDVMYVEELIGKDTVNTVPDQTLSAFKNHGKACETLNQGLDDARETLSQIKGLGIDLEQATSRLLTEGLAKFSEPFDKLLASLEIKRERHLGARLNHFSYQMPVDVQRDISRTLDDWQAKGTLRALWKHDPSVWTRSGEEKWLGWLDMAAHELRETDELQQFSEEVRKKGFRHVVLLGMGGSSLCAEVLAKTFGEASVKGVYLEYHGLDSTDPVQIKELEDSISIEHTLFIVSSKSGSTLEPNIFFDYFFDRMKSCVGLAEAGSHFVAITDPGTSLEKKATEAGFLRIFHGVPSIGGRYSVLSHFGMVPAALIGVDVKRLLAQALHMVWSCASRVPPSVNPGVQLGVILGTCAKHGRDKVTLICSRDISAFGAWLEQLLAESTGKQGKGLIPVDREKVRKPEAYGPDRIFVYLRSDASVDSEADLKVHSLEKAGQPVVRVGIHDHYNLGQEFFRWEMATSVAGSILGINPFDQPDVEASKDVTRRLTSEYEAKGRLPDEVPVFQSGDIQIFDDPENMLELRKRLHPNPSVSDYLRAHLSRVGSGDYFAILAYIPMSPRDEELLQSMRDKIGASTKAATCVEFGPRFLHSTGQAYKGGPNSGVFLQITCDDASDIPVPGHKYSFGVVKAAEARGDFEVLTGRRRRAMRIHLRRDPRAGLEQLNQELDKAVA